MTDISPTTLLVIIALLSTHHHQPKGRQLADQLQAHLDQLPPTTSPTSPTQEDEDQ